MTRSNYTDDYDEQFPNALEFYRRNVENALCQSLTDEQLIWAAYSSVPKKIRQCNRIEKLSPEAKRIWLAIALRRIAGGWDYPWHTPAS